jgi:unsaturated chondroitin disaccharide hydrolase
MKSPSFPPRCSIILLLASFLGGSVTGLQAQPTQVLIPSHATLDHQIEDALEHAKLKMQESVTFLEAVSAAEPIVARRPHYPQYTVNKTLTPGDSRPDGQWVTARADGSFWARGSFAALLWMMAEIEEEGTPQQSVWKTHAKTWSQPLVNYWGGDVTVNHYAVFGRWLKMADSEVEHNSIRQDIINVANKMAAPYVRATNTGNFHEDIGIYGYRRQDDATKTMWFHAFVDHTPNVEQMLAGSWLVEDPAHAMELRSKAIRHIVNMHKTMGAGRNPGDSGSWQRGYFDWNEGSPTYGQFLFNEGKQGWTNASTWSRGQAWWLYGASVAAYHTRNPQVIQAAREAAIYYSAMLPDRYPGAHRQPGVYVPAWDFDFAWSVNFETDYDTSAAAIAVAGLVRLVAALPTDDPDRDLFLEVLQGTLLNLTAAPFLSVDAPEMSILREGGYHHPSSIAPSSHYNNGLIWGDYFFVDALLMYRNLRDQPPAVPTQPLVSYDTAANTVTWTATAGTVFQWETSPDLLNWQDHSANWLQVEADAEQATPVSFDMPHRFWRLRAWTQPE